MLKRHRRWLACCLFVALVAATPAHADEEPEPFTLNLKEAELGSLIETVAQRTGRRFIVDPRVDARVTVISSVPVEDEELYEVFQAVLSVHGYAAVALSEMTLIIPASTAPQQAIPVDDDEALGAGVVTRVLPVEHIAAEQVVPVIQPLLGRDGQLAAYGPTNRLIITDSAANIDRLRRIIGRIDRPIEQDIETVRLDHANAEEMVRVLTELAQAEDAGDSRIAADPRTNSVLIRGGEQVRVELRALIADLDQPADVDEDTRVVHLRHANAEDMVDIIAEAGRAQAELQADDAPEGQSREPIVQADANSNALVLSGRPDIITGLEGLIRQLDIRRAQVHVEALIAEVSMDQARELGVQFAARGEDGEIGGLTRFGGEGSDIVSIASSPESIGSGFSLGAVTEDGSGNEFGALLRAVASDAENNILSTPSLVTMDNQQAEILVGENVPFVTGQFTGDAVGDDAGRSPFQTIEREDVGISLGITPQINEGDTVQLEIEQEVSDLSGTAQAADLVTNTREIRTTVVVENEQTLVLGGLIDESVRSGREQVPLLGSIPVLGQLFRYDTTDRVKQNLMVFLQPTILRDAAAGDRVTQDPYEEMRARQLDHQEDSRALGADGLPTLPELEIDVDE